MKQIVAYCIFVLTPMLGWGHEVEVSYDGLERVENSAADLVYVKSGLDLRPYAKVMIDPISISYKRTPRAGTQRRATGARANFALTDAQRQRMKDTFREVFVEELTADDGWPVVEEPGPDVLRFQAELIDLVVKVPTDLQTTAGRTDVWLEELGEATLAGELRDAETGEILARFSDRKVARTRGRRMVHASSVQTWAEVRRVFRQWAKLMRTRLDEVRELEPAEE